uniref:Ferritin n=1 Tax=Rhinolophus ferrumequinum TaxID=59479 RepID=A0A671G4I6_RHIFE
MTTAPPSYVRQNYYPECEAAINNQIVLELYASYVYESMASYFSSHEVALKRFAGFFLQQSSQERKHAERLMELQNQRGGHLRLRDISRPDRNRWENGLKAMECALHLERSVNQSLLDLHQLATENKDAHLCQIGGLGSQLARTPLWRAHPGLQ